MSLKLTILCDNTVAAKPGLIGEHGFSCHIEAYGNQYLFDTGSGLGVINNAATCGVDLTAIKAVLLSHGHWDHCGGLIEILRLRKNQATPVYAHPSIFAEKVRYDKGVERDIGAGFTREEAELEGAIFHLSNTPTELPGSVIFSGEIPREIEAGTDNSLYYRHQGDIIPDPLFDDQSLYIKSSSGLVVLCGCAHAGVENILSHALSLTGAKKLHALIGGLHLKFKESSQIARISQELSTNKIQLIAASHCTGHKAINQLTNTFGTAMTTGEVSRSFHF